MKSTTHLKKTLVFSFALASASSFLSYLVQSKANASVDSCSYLDPITVDILALILGAFLMAESVVDIVNHKHSYLRNQLLRCFRMALGACIVTIHVMQFLHK